jgi:hypothetical protein
MTIINIPLNDKYCEWCQIVPAEIFVVYNEPIQLCLFHETMLCQYLCKFCLEEARVAEQYAEVS